MDVTKEKKSYYPLELIGSTRFGVVLLLFLAVDLLVGYFVIERQTPLFEALNRSGLWSWLETYGRHNLVYTGWFFVFLLLMVLLVANTTSCTSLRLLKLWQQRHGGWQRHAFALSTHVMHLAIIIILTGYLASYTLAAVFPSMALLPGRVAAVTTTPVTMTLLELDHPYYQGERLPATFSDRVLQPVAKVRVNYQNMSKEMTLEMNRAGYFKGYGFFMQRFSPTSKSGMSNKTYIVVDVRRDPGVILYFVGIVVFLVGMVAYALCWYRAQHSTK